MRTFTRLAVAAGLVLSVGLVTPAAAADCPDDSVRSGTACVDKFEASVWSVPPQEKQLIAKIREGKVTLLDLTAAGALQLGLAAGDLAAAGCPRTGNGCVDVYAVSIPDVMPAGFVTYYQALAAARNSRKRLPTDQEWQAAALGTPDSAPCNVGPDGAIALTGSQAGCVSDVGAFDMVGNTWERLGEFQDFTTQCHNETLEFGGDLVCVGSPDPSVTEFAWGNANVLRGGFFGALGLGGGASAGVFAVRANSFATFAPGFGIGFRCVR